MAANPQPLGLGVPASYVTPHRVHGLDNPTHTLSALILMHEVCDSDSDALVC